MVASDQLKSTLAATDAKNRYEVQILVANKINDIASRVLELADRQGDKTSANKEIGNMLLGLDETFVIADDLHREGGFVSGWGEFIKRNCDRLQRNGYYKGVGTAEPLSKTKGICEAYLEK